MVLKNTNATLEELTARENAVKSDIRTLKREQKQIRGTIRSFQRLVGSAPAPAKKKRSRKAPKVAAASA